MKCTHKKDNGERCGANAMRGARLCYLHNPAIPREEKREAQARGGSNRGVILSQPLPAILLEKPSDTVKILVDTIQRVRAGEMDVRIANSIGVLSGQLLKAFEVPGGKGEPERVNIFRELKERGQDRERYLEEAIR